MISNKPYLLRAFYQWINDSACTPILVVDATHPRCKVPKDYIEDGEIIFNIAQNAIRDINISNDRIEFKASFSGVIHIIFAPTEAILAIYAEENGEGIFFDADDAASGSDGQNLVRQDKKIHLATLDGAHLESQEDDNTIQPQHPIPEKGKPVLRLVE